MTKIIINPTAQNDINQIYLYISQQLHNDSAAVHMTEKIYDVIGTLENFPDSGNFLSNIYSNVKPKYQNYRLLVAGNYIILYLYEADSDIVYVDFVFDSRTNYATKITED